MLVKNKIKRDWFFERGAVSLAHYFRSQYQFTNDWTEVNTNETLIRKGLELEPITVIEMMFPLITTKKTISEVILTSIGNVGREDYSFGVFADAKINDCVRLTSLEVDSYGLLEDQDQSDDYNEISLLEEINNSSYDLSLHSYNRFTGEFSMVGSFNGDNYDYEIACQRTFCVKAIAWGILGSDASPAWIEYLVDASLNFQAKDYKMASLNYFSAYENFISIIHDELIFDYLAKKSEKTDIEMIALRAFAQNRKRLSAKAIAVAKFLKMYNKNMKDLIKKLDKYSERRNKIAHGAATNINYDVPEMAYLIIAYMFCIGRQDNVLKNDWKEVVN